MCEYVTKPSKKAKEDIVVYKIVSRNIWDNTCFIPAFVSKKIKYKLEKTYKSRLSCSWKYFNHSLFKFKSLFTINRELSTKKGLYSYGDPKSARLLNYLNVFPRSVLIKCIIPKGSTYFKTKDGVYISNKLTLIKVIKR